MLCISAVLLVTGEFCYALFYFCTSSACVVLSVDPYEATSILVSRQRYWSDGDEDRADRVCRWLQPHLSSVICRYDASCTSGFSDDVMFLFL